MASSWGSSWGNSWGGSWGSVAAAQNAIARLNLGVAVCAEVSASVSTMNVAASVARKSSQATIAAANSAGVTLTKPSLTGSIETPE